MKTRLEILFDTYELSEKDRHEFLAIYTMLPSEKRIRVIENFESIMQELQEHKNDLYLEQEILFGESLRHIEETLSRLKYTHTQSEI